MVRRARHLDWLLPVRLVFFSSSWPLSRESCGLTAERMLPTAYDRYVLVSAALRLPAAAISGGRWPIVLRVHPLRWSREGKAD